VNRTSNIETELKFAVRDRKDFRRLQRYLQASADVTEQLNLYLIAREPGTDRCEEARLRITAQTAWLTNKRRMEAEGDSVFRALETEIEIDRPVAASWLQGNGKLPLSLVLGAPSGKPESGNWTVELEAWSSNKRHAYDMGEGFVLLADETGYGNSRTDHELELEHEDTERAEEIIDGIASRAGVRLEPQRKTKRQRAIENSGDEKWVVPGYPSDRTTFAACLIGVLVFLGYLAFLPSTHYWLDAPEFMAASWNMAQPHPPGHPVVVVLLKAFMSFPLGDAAFRANLFSALFAAVSSMLLFLITLFLVGRDQDGRRDGFTGIVAGLVAALGFGWGGSAVIQAMSVEVYTFNCALVFGALLLALRNPGDWKAGSVIAVLVALGFGNHHLLTLLAMPPLVLAFAGGPRVSMRGWIPVTVIAAWVVAGAYAMLVMRDLAGAWPAWAEASSPSDLLWIASATIFSGSIGGFENPAMGLSENAVKAFAMIAENCTPLGPVLALGGLYLMARTGGGLSAAVIVLWVVCDLVSKVAMGILDPSNPDDHGYFLPGIGGVFILEAIFVAWLFRMSAEIRGVWGRNLLRSVGIVFLAVIASPAISTGLPVAVQRSRFDDTREVGRLVLQEQPARSVLLVSHYPVLFLTYFQQYVEGRRPDVTVLQESLFQKARGGSWYAGRVTERDIDLAPLTNAFIEKGTLSWERLLELDSQRPVRIEPSDAWSDVEPAPMFDGWVTDVRNTSEPARNNPDYIVLTAGHLERARRSVNGWGNDVDVESRRVLIRNFSAMARHLQRSGNMHAAAMLIGAALELNPMDRDLKAMAHGLEPNGGG